MSTRQDYLEAIGFFVPGDSFLVGQSEKYAAITLAMAMHSKNSPLVYVQDVSGDGGFDYPLSTLTYWSDGFSVISSVEYAVDDDTATIDTLQAEEWIVCRKPGGKYLRFLSATPSGSESFRVIYTAPHSCTDSACTVEDNDDYFCKVLAAAYFCEILSTSYAPIGDSMLAADSVDHTGKSREFALRAKNYRQMYLKHMGLSSGGVPAASLMKDWDKDPSWQSDRLTHPRKYR